MKKVRNITVILLLFLLIIPNVVYAIDDANPASEMVPKIEDLYNYKDNKYFTEYKNNYYLDIEDTFIKGKIGQFLNEGANLIFGLEVLLTQILASIIYYTFDLSIFDLFSGPLDIVVKNLKVGIFDEFVLLCIAFIGVYFAVKMIKNQKTQVWVALAKMLGILVLSFLFFLRPATTLRGIDSISKEIGQAALEGTYKATMNGESSHSATESITTNIWVMFVHKPWQILEFGNTTFAEEYEDEILRLTPGCDERQDIIEDIAKDDIHFKSSLGLQRLCIMFLYFIIFILLSIVIIAFCGLIIGYQFLMMIYAAMGPLVLLVALIPSFGFNTVKTWAGKLISYGGMKAILSLVIAILFSFLISTYEFTDQYGILMVSLIQIALLIVVWVKRESLLEGFLKFATASRDTINPATTTTNRLRQDISIENGIRNWNRKRQEYKEQKRMNSEGYQENYQEDYQEDINSNPINSKEPRRKRAEYYGNNGYRRNDKGYDFAEDNRMGNINNNLNELRKIAEDILEEKYKKSKTESETKAELTGKSPEYSNWVKTVMNREEMNLPKFDEREKQAVVNQIKEAKAIGIDIKDIEDLNYNESDKYIKRPKNIEVDRPKEIKVQEEKLTASQASKQYLNDFNKSFGKNYNEKFMSNLVESYGQENVGNVVNDMIRIDKDTEIKNPAGYLLKALNNNKGNEANENMGNHISVPNSEGHKTAVTNALNLKDNFNNMEIKEDARDPVNHSHLGKTNEQESSEVKNKIEVKPADLKDRNIKKVSNSNKEVKISEKENSRHVTKKEGNNFEFKYKR